MNAEHRRQALILAEAGISVVRDRMDGTKAPVGSWKAYQEQRATAEQINEWWPEDKPLRYALGIVTGAISGNAEMFEFEGRAVRDKLPGKMGQLMADHGMSELWDRVKSGWRVKSPSGGRHLHYIVSGPARPSIKLAQRPSTAEELKQWKADQRAKAEEIEDEDKRAKRLENIAKAGRSDVPQVLIETRGEGGHVVVPPSNGTTHPSGRAWVTEAGGPETRPVLTLEERDALYAIAQLLDEMPGRPEPKPSTGKSGEAAGSRPGDLYNAEATWEDVLEPHGWTVAHQNGLYREWWRPGKGPGESISATTGRNEADNLFVFSTAAWPFEAQRWYDKFGAYALLEHNDDKSAAAKALYAQGYRSTEDDGDGEASGNSDAEADLANARLLAKRYSDDLRYVVPWAKWLVWTGTHWMLDETGEVWRYAKKVADTLPRKNIKGGPSRPQTRSGLSAMIALAGTEPGIAISHKMLDTDPFLLNCKNKTLDLRTGKLHDHDRKDLITKVTGAAYDPDATSDEFDTFLARIQPGEEMRAFLARLLGHALEGRQVVHTLPIFWGGGSNGKGTLVNAALHAIGDYGAPADPELLVEQRFGAHPTGKADLYGLRIAVLHETDKDRRLAEGTVKRLTGGDPIKARRMREDFWWFDASHTFIMQTNHRPKVSGTDDGIWRRLKLVPFDVQIPLAERDENLGDKLKLAAEAVLAWMVRGHADWKARGGGENGLADPERVREATSEFRVEEDLLSRFLDERCETDYQQATVGSSALFEAWTNWTYVENLPPDLRGTQTSFSADLKNRGFEKKKVHGTMTWFGIRLRVAESEKKSDKDPFDDSDIPPGRHWQD